MLVTLVDWPVLKCLVVDAIDDRDCHRGVVPVRGENCFGSKKSRWWNFTCILAQEGAAASSCWPGIHYRNKEEEEILVDLAVGIEEHHHHSLRLLCPARSRPCVNMRMMRMTKMVFDDLSTWSALRAQCFWRDGQVLWRSGCSSSNPEKVLWISFFCFFSFSSFTSPRSSLSEKSSTKRTSSKNCAGVLKDILIITHFIFRVIILILTC